MKEPLRRPHILLWKLDMWQRMLTRSIKNRVGAFSLKTADPSFSKVWFCSWSHLLFDALSSTSFAASPAGDNHRLSDLSLPKEAKSKSPLLIPLPSSVLKWTGCIEFQRYFPRIHLLVSFSYAPSSFLDSTVRQTDMMLLDKLAISITINGLLCCLVQGLNLLWHLLWLSCRRLGGICWSGNCAFLSLYLIPQSHRLGRAAPCFL